VDSETRELARRLVKAVENLAEDPEIQVEVHPPVCPHCEQINPAVKVRETEAEGQLAEFVIRAQCMNCGNEFYALPFQMDCVSSLVEAQELMQERMELGGYNGGESQRTAT
jgi:RNase P subunit RPR2